MNTPDGAPANDPMPAQQPAATTASPAGNTSSLDARAQWLGAVLYEVPELLLVIGHDGAILVANREAARVTGYRSDELCGQAVGNILQLKGLPVDSPMLGRLAGRNMELQLLTRNRDRVEMACSASPVAVAPGPANGADQAYVLIARDLSERRHAMEKIRNLSRLVDESPGLILRIDADLRLQYANPAGRAFARAHDCRVGSRVPDSMADTALEVMRSGRKIRREEDVLERTWSMLYMPVRGQTCVNVYGMDVTDRIDIERTLLNNAYYDELTGLPNRALLRDHVDQALQSFKRRPERAFGLIEIDLDRFRYVNETYGHAIGDELLKACADRLKDCFFARDTIAHFSSDAFCVLQQRISGLDDLLSACGRMMESFAKPFQIGEHELYVSACAGIVSCETRYESGEELIRDADTALYRAKDLGRGCHMVFDESMQERMRRFLSLEGRLRSAIRLDEFVMHYQPKVNTIGELCGFEALIRWPDSDGGMVSPAEFIPVAEDSGLIIDLGNWITNAVCAQISEWQQTFPNMVPVAINVSGQQFEQKGFVRNFRQILDNNHVPGELVHAEITESSLMGEIWSVVKRLRKLADIGVVSAIDDFGTGYSSLAYLKQFPVSYLKVDQAFVRDMHENEEDYAITSAIIAMAHQLRLKVIAEGVENELQLAMLNALDCDQIQGYYFSKPLPPERAAEIIEQGGIYY